MATPISKPLALSSGVLRNRYSNGGSSPARVPIAIPNLSLLLPAMSFRPLSFNASFAAVYVYLCIVFAVVSFSKTVSTLKSFTSHARCTLYSDESNDFNSAVPSLPFMRAFQAFVTPIPLAVTNPKPVTTTLGMFKSFGKIQRIQGYSATVQSITWILCVCHIQPFFIFSALRSVPELFHNLLKLVALSGFLTDACRPPASQD